MTSKKTPFLDLTGTTCIWGQSESGKSFLAQRMLQQANPPQAVIIDPMSEHGLDNAPAVLRALEAGQERIVCNTSVYDHQVGAILYALNHSQKAHPVYVVADEAPSYLNKPRAGISRAVLQGRHAGFGMMILGQRPASVFAEYRTQAKRTYWLRLSDHTDLETARKSMGPKAETLSTLKQGEFIAWPPKEGK